MAYDQEFLNKINLFLLDNAIFHENGFKRKSQNTSIYVT